MHLRFQDAEELGTGSQSVALSMEGGYKQPIHGWGGGLDYKAGVRGDRRNVLAGSVST